MQIVPTITAAVIPPTVSTQITPAVVTALARELAMKLREEPDILALLKVSVADYEKLKQDEWFQNLVDTLRAEWHAATNTTLRNQVEAALCFEQALPVIYGRIVNGKEALNHCVDGMKLLADVGGIKKQPTQGAGGEKYTIEINFGENAKVTWKGDRQPVEGGPVIDLLPVPEVDDRAERV